MNLENRLQRLEQFAGKRLAGNTDADQRRELQRLFTSDADNARLVGSSNLRRLLVSDEPGIGELRRAVGRFLRVKCFQCPEAEIILVRALPGRPDQSRVVVSGDTNGERLLQIVECEDQP